MKFLKAAFIGMVTGVFIANLIGLPFMDAESRNIILGVMFLTSIIGGFSRIYNTKLALLPAALIHILSSLTLFLITAYLSHWFPFKVGIILPAVFIFLLIFCIIWTVYYFIEKKKIASLNDKLR